MLMNFTQIHVKIDIIVIIMNTIKFEEFNNSITTFIYIFVRNNVIMKVFDSPSNPSSPITCDIIPTASYTLWTYRQSWAKVAVLRVDMSFGFLF